MDTAVVERQTSQRSGRRVLVVLIVVVLAGVGGALVGMTAGGEIARGATPPTPAPPTDFPDIANRSPYLPDATMDAVRGWMDDNGYACEDGDPGSQGPQHTLLCGLPQSHGTARSDVFVDYDGSDRVVMVRASCLRGASTSERFCPTVFRDITRVLYADGPDVDDATTWVRENARNDAATVIGDVQLVMDLGRHMLTITRGS